MPSTYTSLLDLFSPCVYVYTRIEQSDIGFLRETVKKKTIVYKKKKVCVVSVEQDLVRKFCKYLIW